MKRSSLFVMLVGLLVFAGCGGSTKTQPAPPQTTPPQAAPAPTMSPQPAQTAPMTGSDSKLQMLEQQIMNLQNQVNMLQQQLMQLQQKSPTR